MLRFSDFVTCRKRYYNQGKGGLYLRPKSVCAVEMTMYVLHLTCVNIYEKDVPA